jgi:acyl dehydratase
MTDKSKLGMEFPVYTMVVDKTKIAEFVAAVALKDSKEEIDPIYYDEEAAKKAGYKGIPVPPTFMTSFFFWANGLMRVVKALNADLGKLLHNEEEYEYFGYIYAGDVVTCKMKVVEMYERGKRDRLGRFVDVTVLETEVINQRGELVVKVRSTMIER